MSAKKRTRPARPLPDVSIKVDARLKKLYDGLLARIEAARKEEAQDFDRLYEAVAEVLDHDPPLWPIGGYANPGEFCQDKLGAPLRTVQRNIRVARYATAKDIDTYGATRLDAALGWIEAKTGGPVKGELPVAFDRVRIPVTRAGEARAVGLSDATVEEIERATKALGKGAKKGPKSAARTALLEGLGKHKALAEVDVSVSGGMASFRRVPLASLDLFGRALVAAKVNEG